MGLVKKVFIAWLPLRGMYLNKDNIPSSVKPKRSKHSKRLDDIFDAYLQDISTLEE